MSRQSRYWQSLFVEKRRDSIASISLFLAEKKSALYRLSMGGYAVIISEFGARVLSFVGPDDVDVVLAPENPLALVKDPFYLGATVGRVCNRIKNGQLALEDGQSVQLDRNDGDNHLHGGYEGFDKKFWAFVDSNKTHNAATLILAYYSMAGDQSYPGALLVQAKFCLNERGQLRIEYTSQSLERSTPVNITHHGYWNLSGDDSESVDRGHDLETPASQMLVRDNEGLPSGEILSLDRHRLDFRTKKPIATDSHTAAIDAYLILPANPNGDQLLPVAELSHRGTKRRLLVCSNQPGFQLYTGAFLLHPFIPHQGLCIECSAYIDAPHHENFPSIMLGAFQISRQISTYQLLVD